MLMYHPAQDANHCVFRLLLILQHTEHEYLDIQVYRLIDFYILFPHLVNLLNPLPRPINRFKKEFIELSEPFESLKNTRRVLNELETLQNFAIQSLLAKQLLDIEAYESGRLQRTDEKLKPEIEGALVKSPTSSAGWFKALVNEFPKVKFEGKTGLKARTGLMEYRYDVERS